MTLFLTNNMFPTVLLLIPLFAIMRRAGILYTLRRSFCRTRHSPFRFRSAPECYLNDLPMSHREAAW